MLFIPPNRFDWAVRWEKPTSSKHQFYLETKRNLLHNRKHGSRIITPRQLLEAQTTRHRFIGARQRNFDFAGLPDGYWLVNASTGFSTKMSDSRLDFKVSVENGLNQSYREYTNRFRFMPMIWAGILLHPFNINFKSRKHIYKIGRLMLMALTLSACIEEQRRKMFLNSSRKATLTFTPLWRFSCCCFPPSIRMVKVLKILLPMPAIVLEQNKTYVQRFAIQWVGWPDSPEYNITNEVQEEGDEHLFFAWTNNLFSMPSGDGEYWWPFARNWLPRQRW